MIQSRPASIKDVKYLHADVMSRAGVVLRNVWLGWLRSDHPIRNQEITLMGSALAKEASARATQAAAADAQNEYWRQDLAITAEEVVVITSDESVTEKTSVLPGFRPRVTWDENTQRTPKS